VSFRLASLEQATLVLPYGSDAFTLTLSGGNTVETWKFFKGGTGGIQQAQWVLTYTDSTRATLVSGVYTDLSA
jgi:hypothetical protein